MHNDDAVVCVYCKSMNIVSGLYVRRNPDPSNPSLRYSYAREAKSSSPPASLLFQTDVNIFKRSSLCSITIVSDCAQLFNSFIWMLYLRLILFVYLLGRTFNTAARVVQRSSRRLVVRIQHKAIICPIYNLFFCSVLFFIFVNWMIVNLS